MPHSADEATQRAEQLERKAHDAILEFRLEEAVGRLRDALAIREAYQGDVHPDLIWTLSLWIYALGRKHRPESALEAARLGERRLALRRTALAGAPDELAHSLRELIGLYTFEYDVLDTGRVDELRRALAEAGGSGQEA
jgi:hypothetical protein